jgi:hypothetical protein
MGEIGDPDLGEELMLQRVGNAELIVTIRNMLGKPETLDPRSIQDPPLQQMETLTRDDE